MIAQQFCARRKISKIATWRSFYYSSQNNTYNHVIGLKLDGDWNFEGDDVATVKVRDRIRARDRGMVMVRVRAMIMV